MDNRAGIRVEFLILCTQMEVMQSLLHFLDRHELHVDKEGGANYVTSEIKFKSNPPSKLVLVETGAGNANAAITAAKAIRKWNPKNVLLVGVSTSLDERVKIGDILIANQVVSLFDKLDYEVQDIVNTSPRLIHLAQEYYKTWVENEGLTEIVRQNLSKSKTKEKAPRLHVGNLVSANRVLSARDIPPLQDEPKSLGIEMEGFGIGQVIRESRAFNPSYLIIRSVSDNPLEKKRSIVDFNAAQIASSFTIGLIKTLTKRKFGSYLPAETQSAVIESKDIEITVDISGYSEEEKIKLLDSIRKILEIEGDIQITKSRPS
jgi:nucleoside phosphorylase